MLFRKKLAGKRIAVLATDGFEQVELTIPTRALRAEGATVEVISLHDGKIRGMNLHLPGRKVRVDRLVQETNPAMYDGLLVPGGFINPDILRQSQDARSFVRTFDTLGKPIATICHGPWLLASAELVQGRQLTSWPGIRDDIVHAGGIWRDEEVVRDGNWVSSRGPQDMRAFVRSMIELFAEQVPIRRATSLTTVSAPPRMSPPFTGLSVDALLPKPSMARRLLRGALIGAAALVPAMMGLRWLRA